MIRRTPGSLRWLGVLLALYLCAPLVASIPRIASADWAGVDWSTLASATGVSAASATLAAAVIGLGGIPLGYWLARKPGPLTAIVGFVVQLPLALPPLTSGILLLFLLGPYSLLGRWAHGALTDSFLGILLAGVFVAAPFLIIAARSAFAEVDPILEDVAATLGHHAPARFLRVALPLAWPSIRAGLLLSWLRAFGEFGATVMVAYHPYSLPVYTYVAFGSQGLPAMMPIILPTLTLALLLALLAAASARRSASSNKRLSDSASMELTPNTPISSRPAAARSNDACPSGALAFDFRKTIGTFTLDIAWRPTARRLAILGESGSGKSMTLRLLAGLETAEQAHFSIGDKDYAAQAAEARHIAYVPQDFGLFPHMSVKRQWAFARDADPARASAWAAHLGLSGLEERLPAALSIGQRQRVSIVRALARPCPLILLDEPFAALDTPRRKQLRSSLRQLQMDITAHTILVTHDPDEAALLADEILLIDRGEVLQYGPTATLFARPANMKVASLLGLANINAGVLADTGELAIGEAIHLNIPADAHRDIAPGQAVLWRVDEDAISITRLALDIAPSSAAPRARVEALDWENGQRYLLMRLGHAHLKLADRYANIGIGDLVSIDIAPKGITLWAAHSAAASTTQAAAASPVATPQAIAAL